MMPKGTSCSSEDESERPESLIDNPLRYDNESKRPKLIDEKDFEGRIRSVEHKDGNWASFVYLDMTKALDGLLHFSNLSKDDMGALRRCESLHMSLSKLFMITYDNIQPLKKELEAIVTHYPHLRLSLDVAGGLKVFLNEEKTRTFIGLSVTDPEGLLSNLQEGIDSVLEERDLPAFYDPPDYHVSILWCLGDQAEDMKSRLGQIQRLLLRDNSQSVQIPQSVLHLKCGHKVFNVPLSNY